MRRALMATGLVLLLGTACTADPSATTTSGAATRLAWGDCPRQVDISITAGHRCGVLIVPVLRGRPGSATLGLEVVQVWPGERADEHQVALSVGFNYGEPAHEPGTMA